MRYFLIAGEASGDLHGANLMRSLLKSDPEAEFRFWGGDDMAEVGGLNNLARHYKTASFFGFTEVIANLGTVLSQIRECKAEISAYAPDVLILIDYPGFNFRMAKYAHRRGIKTFYYISPKVWAWKESRIKLIRRYVDRLFIIFPFEAEYFRRRGIEAVYCGNPLVDAVRRNLAAIPSEEQYRRCNSLDERPIIALLAGSRRSEIKNNLPIMAALSRRFEEYQFVVAGVGWIERELYDRYIGDAPVRYVCDQTCAALRYAAAAVVTSGTATLETAIVGTPEVVCYRTDALQVWAGRRLLKIKYISLVNLIMDRRVVAEVIQSSADIGGVERELRAILPGSPGRYAMLRDFERLRTLVGGDGASDRFAARMVEELRSCAAEGSDAAVKSNSEKRRKS